jgi:hypothetical protein
MDDPDSFLEKYAALESQIRTHMTQLFSETCGLCTACCCRVDICEEVQESAFLRRLLIKQGRSTEELDDRFGWLDLQGCSLEYGRPPICYAYFCDELLARLPDDQSRWAVKILGRLVEYIGEDAVGESHLTEIRNVAVLEQLDFSALNLRLEKARDGLGIIEQYLETGLLSKAERDMLETFTPAEA